MVDRTATPHRNNGAANSFESCEEQVRVALKDSLDAFGIRVSSDQFEQLVVATMQMAQAAVDSARGLRETAPQHVRH